MVSFSRPSGAARPGLGRLPRGEVKERGERCVFCSFAKRPGPVNRLSPAQRGETDWVVEL
jgi:hypothetical protein